MRRLRPFLLAFAVLVSIPLVANALIQTQRAQIAVNITINVTPAPVAFHHGSPAASDTSAHGIVTKLSFNARETARAAFSAQSLSFVSGHLVAANQQPVKVEAEVSPNPFGTLLFSNLSGVIINQVAGTTQVYHCYYTVTVDTTITAWTLEHGLFTDFKSGSGDTFTGHDVANNSYLSTPHPTATPFIVYADGQSWVILGTNGGMKTYCIDLTVTVPVSASQGTYSSNAVYTLYY